VDAGKVDFALRECNSVKTSTARQPHRRSGGESVRAHPEHQNIALLAARYINGALRAHCQDSRIPDIPRELLDAKSGGNPQIFGAGRTQFRWFEM